MIVRLRRPMILSLPALAALMAVLAATGLFRQTDPGGRAGSYQWAETHLQQFIPPLMKRHKITGLSIALVDDQGLIWAHGFGYADAARRAVATPETVYRAGSIAKLFTAMAVMQLVEQGKLDLDRPLSDFLPGFAIKSRFDGSVPITLRSVLTHHSGLPSDWLGMMWNSAPVPFTDLAAQLREEYTAAPPGVVYSYSNVGYTLLGHVVQTASGQDFARYMREALLDPLGMQRSSFQPAALPELSKGYRGGREADELPVLMPAGGLQSTVLDLGRMVQMVLAGGQTGEGRVLRPESLAEMLRPQNEDLPFDADLRTGLGWLLGGQGMNYAGRMAQHGGSTLLFFSQLTALLDHKLGVVVMANSAGAAGVVEEIAQEALRVALQAKTGITPPPPPAGPALCKPSVETMRRHEGTYATLMGVFHIKAQGSGLKSRLSGQPILLKPQSDGGFTPRFLLFGLIPIRVPQLAGIRFRFEQVGDHALLLLDKAGDRTLLGEKITRTPIPQAWLRRTGAYAPMNLGGDSGRWLSDARLRLEDGWLVMSVNLASVGLQEFALKPLSDTQAVVYGLGRNMGQTLRVETSGGGERLLFSGCEFVRTGR